MSNQLETTKEVYEEQLQQAFKIRDSIEKYRHWIAQEQEKLTRVNFKLKILDEEINHLLDSQTMLENAQRLIEKSKILKVPQNILRLPLKMKWFKMTSDKIKKEDYREINEYWCHRLIELNPETESVNWADLIKEMNDPLAAADAFAFYGVKFKGFTTNCMTLGYPKNGDLDRILETRHGGIEIRTGLQEWGAEPGKIYFVIKHDI